eukprot:m.23585 g.23585  ORF g.23585 m.23585 type:complete len:285 (-) comp11408_c0_seq1:343-1197(-)
MSDAPPSYNENIPGSHPDDPSLTSIVPPGETVLHMTRPTNPEDVGKATCRQCLAPLAIPCLWIHAIIGAPCWVPALLQAKYVAIQGAKSQIVILTNRAIYSYVGEFDSCCCPGCHGCSTSGAKTSSIPLERVTNVNVRLPGSGTANRCMVDLERLEIETAGSPGPELVIIGAEDADAFKLAVLKAREDDRHGGARSAAVVAAQPTAETKRLKVRLNRDADKVKLVTFSTTDDMAQLHQAICTKFDLPESKLRLYLTEDKIEVEAVDELSNNDGVTVCIGAEALD